MLSSSVASDADLLAQWRAGDQRAGNELTGRYFDSVYGFFRNKVVDDIDDLMQETMLACVESGDRFEGRSSFRTYLFGIARNVLFAYFRSNQRHGVLDFEHATIEDLATSPSQHAVRHQQAKHLAHALRRIPVDYQIALELYYWEQMTGDEIAEILEVPPATVRTRLRRGRQQLERQLERLADGRTVLESTIGELRDLARAFGPEPARD